MIGKIENLDISLFTAIPSQTSDGDRRSLLAVQRATANWHKEYVYLEVGSHLGGSIQPHLVDDRCMKIYSIDARPSYQPDDRAPGYIAVYENNSTKRMLSLLKNIGQGDIAKIECIDADASEIQPNRIVKRPQLVLIDGEHTKTAVLSDFQFCSKVTGQDGTILFHDFDFIYPAILQICQQLKKQHRKFLPLKLDDAVFGIFFNPEIVHSDPYLALLYRKNKRFILKLMVKERFKNYIKNPFLKLINSVFKHIN